MNDSISGAFNLTPGTSAKAGRYFGVLCTAAGNVELTLADGSKHTIAVTVGYQAFPFQVTLVSAGANTTATATYSNLI